MFERRVEMYNMDDPNDTYHNEYGVCTTVAGSGRTKTLYIPDEEDYEQFITRDRLFLEVERKGDEGEPLLQYDLLGHAQPAWTQFSSNDSYPVKVKAVKHVVPPDDDLGDGGIWTRPTPSLQRTSSRSARRIPMSVGPTTATSTACTRICGAPPPRPWATQAT